MTHVAIAPMVIIVPVTFLFVLLIILIVKAPKAGAWVVGGLIFLLPIALWRAALAGPPAPDEIFPLVVVPATFLFVLLIILLTKVPKAGAALIVMLVILGGLGAVTVLSYREVVAAVHRATPIPSSVRPPQTALAPALIWSAGVEAELDADIYASSGAAARALGRQMAGPIRTAAGDPNQPIKVILFQEDNERSLVAGFGHALEKELLGVSYSIEADLRNIEPGEVGVTFRVNSLAPTAFQVIGGGDVDPPVQESVRMVATAFAGDRRTSAEARFIDKPWVEDFASFTSRRPQQALVIARSAAACLSESEARQQAMQDAARQVERIVWNSRRSQTPDPYAGPVSSTELQEGGFIVDTFVQSFDGSVGKIWRQAVLLDVSGPKVTRLYNLLSGQARHVRASWTRMGLSAVGVVLLISVIYFFLNMATRGYYEWSLRIAGAVLAIVGVLSILMVVR